MSRGEELSSIAAALRRIEQPIDVLAHRLSTIDDRVAIIDLKLESLDSIFKVMQQIAAAVGAVIDRRPHLDGH